MSDHEYGPHSSGGCPQVSRICEDGRRRDFDCCDTGMRSGGRAHSRGCEWRAGRETMLSEVRRLAVNKIDAAVAAERARCVGIIEQAVRDVNDSDAIAGPRTTPEVMARIIVAQIRSGK